MKSLYDVRHSGWVWQVTVLSVVLGMLLAAALKTQQTVKSISGVQTTHFTTLVQQYLDEKDRNKLLRNEIMDLRVKVDKYEQSGVKDSSKSQLLSDELQKTKLLAGLTSVDGQGLEITVQDVPGGPPPGTPAMLEQEYIIHDLDLRNMINELLANGAEAISVRDQDNEQRIIAVSAIRCVGGPIQINRVPMSPPFTIIAIGPPATMESGLKMTNGLLENWHALPGLGKSMVKIRKKQDVVVPAYSGNTSSLFIYAKPVGAEGGNK